MGLGIVLSAMASRAELAPTTPLPQTGSLWINFEILPSDEAHPLPESLSEIEGVRFYAEQHALAGGTYRKTSVVAPLPSGDRRERVVLFVEENGHLRMLGFHRILRHLDSPQGQTVVFQSGGPPSPLTGDIFEVPADTYDWLGLATAAASLPQPSLPAHLWVGPKPPLAVRLVSEGAESLSVLGSKVPTKRVVVRPAEGSSAPGATYWFSSAPPHVLLQYRGPADFLLEADGSGPIVLMRATASSEQVRRVLER